MNGTPRIGPALAVGHMVLTSDQVRGSGKGKAVSIVHTWKDHLWEMGGKDDPPAPRVVEFNQKMDDEAGAEGSPSGTPDVPAETVIESSGEGFSQPQGESPATPPKEETNPLSRQGKFSLLREILPDQENAEVSDILQSALLQSIATTLSKLPPSSFPISPSVFSETYVSPYRSYKEVSATSTPVDIKHSGYKSLTAFLKASAKEGLIKVKETKGEVMITSALCIHKVRVALLKCHTGVNNSHPSVDGHPNHITVKDVEEKEERKGERERHEEQKAMEKGRELQITLLWKPHMGNVAFFKEAGKE